MTIFGADCTALLSESPVLYCGAAARWTHYDRDMKQPLNVLCDEHRVAPSVLIDDDVPRSAPSEFLLRR